MSSLQKGETSMQHIVDNGLGLVCGQRLSCVLGILRAAELVTGFVYKLWSFEVLIVFSAIDCSGRSDALLCLFKFHRMIPMWPPVLGGLCCAAARTKSGASFCVLLCACSVRYAVYGDGFCEVTFCMLLCSLMLSEDEF